MKLRLKDDRGEFTVDVPMSCYEITYRKFIESQGIEVDTFLGVCEFVDHFCSGDISRLKPASDSSNGSLIRPGQDIGVIDVYYHIMDLIANFEPENLPDIPERRALTFMGLTSLTTGEVIEAMELERVAKEERTEDNLALNANIDFNLGLGQYAILARPRDEQLPYDRAELDAYIEKRLNEVKDVSLAEVLALRFFFLHTSINYRIERISNSFGEVNRSQGYVKRTLRRWKLRQLKNRLQRSLESILM